MAELYATSGAKLYLFPKISCESAKWQIANHNNKKQRLAGGRKRRKDDQMAQYHYLRWRCPAPHAPHAPSPGITRRGNQRAWAAARRRLTGVDGRPAGRLWLDGGKNRWQARATSENTHRAAPRRRVCNAAKCACRLWARKARR
jgi:hypothetical protein